MWGGVVSRSICLRGCACMHSFKACGLAWPTRQGGVLRLDDLGVRPQFRILSSEGNIRLRSFCTSNHINSRRGPPIALHMNLTSEAKPTPQSVALPRFSTVPFVQRCSMLSMITGSASLLFDGGDVYRMGLVSCPWPKEGSGRVPSIRCVAQLTTCLQTTRSRPGSSALV